MDCLRNTRSGARRTGIWIAKAAQHRFGVRARYRWTNQRRQDAGIPLNRTALASMLPTPDCFSRALLVALLAPAP
jgi:hypothetical protein